jgi:hypothetical protein
MSNVSTSQQPLNTPSMSASPSNAINQHQRRQKSYAQELDLPHNRDALIYESCVRGAGCILGYIGMCPCCGCWNPFVPIPQGSVGLISRFGRYYKRYIPIEKEKEII